MNLQKQNTLVAGLGGTGLSVLRYLAHIGAPAAGYDRCLAEEKKQQLAREFPAFPMFSGSLKDALAGRNVLVLSPGITRRQPEIREFEQHGGTVTGDVAIFAELMRGKPDKIIAITGSNGKTTVTSLAAHLCRESGLDTVAAGNIGTPVLDAWLQRQGKSADAWVLELSSFQLETTPHLGATAAACLNISEDHLDRYDDLLDYARSKDQIFNGCAHQILNADDAFCRAMKRVGPQVRYFSLEHAADYWLDDVSGSLKAGTETIIPQNQTALHGRHNMANILAAAALCGAIGIPRAELARHIATFSGLPHRVEQIGEKNGIVFIDDSKGTNVGATVAAIGGLPQPIVLIAGGQGKGQDFTLARAVLRDKARAVFLIGADAAKIARDIEGCGVPVSFCETLPDAVQAAYAAARAGDAVLLSPMCASLDMFRGYAHRSEVFAQAFRALP